MLRALPGAASAIQCVEDFDAAPDVALAALDKKIEPQRFLATLFRKNIEAEQLPAGDGPVPAPEFLQKVSDPAPEFFFSPGIAVGGQVSCIFRPENDIGAAHDAAFTAGPGAPGQRSRQPAGQFGFDADVIRIGLQQRLGAMISLTEAHQSEGDAVFRPELRACSAAVLLTGPVSGTSAIQHRAEAAGGSQKDAATLPHCRPAVEMVRMRNHPASFRKLRRPG